MLCVVSFAQCSQSLLVQTSSSVIVGCTAVAWPYKATCNNSGVLLCLRERWWLMKRDAVFGQIYTNQFGAGLITAALFGVSASQSAGGVTGEGIRNHEQVVEQLHKQIQATAYETFGGRWYESFKRKIDAEMAARESLCVFHRK